MQYIQVSTSQWYCKSRIQVQNVAHFLQLYRSIKFQNCIFFAYHAFHEHYLMQLWHADMFISIPYVLLLHAAMGKCSVSTVPCTQMFKTNCRLV